MKAISIAIGMIAAIVMTALCAPAAETPSETYSRAKSLMNSGNLAAAMKVAQKYKAMKPNDHSGYQLCGLILYRMGKADKAIEQFAKAKRLFPDDYVSETYTGFALLKKGQAKKAVASFNKAAAMNGEYPDCFIGMGAASLKMQDPVKAKMHMKRAMKTAGDNDPEVYKRIAMTYLANGMKSDAAYVYNQYIKIEDENPDIFYRLGKVYESMGNRRCEKAYERAIELKGKNPEYKEALAGWLMKQKRSGEAVALYEEAASLGSKNHEAYWQTGLAAFRKGDYKKAAARIKKALALKKDIPMAMMALSASLLRSGQYREAAEVSRRLTAKEPKNEGAWFNLACACSMSGDKAAALGALRRSIELEGSNAKAARESEMFRKIKSDPEFIKMTK